MQQKILQDPRKFKDTIAEGWYCSEVDLFSKSVAV